MRTSIRNILLIEDNSGDVVLIRELMGEVAPEFKFKAADRLSSALTMLEKESCDVVLLDLGLPDSNGIDTFLEIQKASPNLPIIVLTGLADEELATKAISLGAQDYLVKGNINSDLLYRSLTYSIERKRAEVAMKRLSRRTELILESAGEGIFGLDTNGNHTFINKAAAALLGYEVDELIGKNGHLIYHRSKPDGAPYPAEECPVSAAYRDGTEHSGEDMYWRRDGSIFPVSFTSKPIFEGSAIAGAVVTFRDITERRHAEDKLRRSKELSDALNELNIVIHSTLDVNVIMQRVVADAAKAVGVDGASIGLFEDDSFIIPYAYNLPQELVNQRLAAGDVKVAYYAASVRDVIVFPDVLTDERLNIRFWRKFNVRALVVAPLMVRGKVIGAFSFYCIKTKVVCSAEYADFARKLASSISLALENAHLFDERKQIEEEMRRMAQHDALTGLPNRRLFAEILAIEFAQARRHRSKLAVLFLDLDRFKEVNDTLGHEAGDRLLKKVADRFRRTIREADTVARIGGDEFNMILADISRAEDVSDIALKIVASLREPIVLDGHELHVTTSVGISIYPDDSEEIETLLRYADIAMYHAKENGRNTFRFYNPSINTRSIERIKLESWLRQTIKREELVVYYQPQVDIKSGKVCYAEALVRWNHPDRGLLEPKDFLPLAEETGFITSIDEWVLRTACSRTAAWKKTGLNAFCVTVNLSARRFQSPDLVDMITSVLEETGVAPDCLDLEVTESTAMSNVERSASQLRDLRGMGIHISIDDFGTGYSSLNYLKKLPIERLKIDKSFIHDIARDADDRAIVSAVTAMAHSMKLKVTAEGVETEEQLSFLKMTGCDEMQGFLFSKPVPAEQFEELIAATGTR